MAAWIAALSVACLLLSPAAGASVSSTAAAAAADVAAGSSIKRRLQAALDHADGDAAVDQVGLVQSAAGPVPMPLCHADAECS